MLGNQGRKGQVLLIVQLLKFLVLQTCTKRTRNTNTNFSKIVIFTSFDLWMSCNSVDTFTLVIKFLNDICASIHVVVGLFEVNETIE
jgi:hypothetical protein